ESGVQPANPAAGARDGHMAPANRPPRRLYAALDLGTNNCRLLVAKPEGASYRVVDAFSRIVRLGEGLGQTGRLSEAAMDRAIEALK
ncbi:Ppx/GppA phosphatase family protein, partial [Klebsiella aerogenes]|uniref:Ppx/GppA phosphatase family protein n=1 Tax=Klebsiella aerogenes TaxID=548 RepID=UPI0034D30595